MSSTSQPNRLYSLIKDLNDLAPCEDLFETDVFGVEIPDSGLIYFVSILGSEGQIRGMSAYKSAAALSSFWELEINDNCRPVRSGRFLSRLLVRRVVKGERPPCVISVC